MPTLHVPATEYFQRKDGCDDRYAIVRRDGQPLAIVGLWESWVSPAREVQRAHCIITVPANRIVATIHDRMPLILEPEDWPLWLGEEPDDPAQLLRLSADGQRNPTEISIQLAGPGTPM